MDRRELGKGVEWRKGWKKRGRNILLRGRERKVKEWKKISRKGDERLIEIQ